MPAKAKKGENVERIYRLLRRNPNLTSNEIASHLPDLSVKSVQSTVSRMFHEGALGSRFRRPERGPMGRVVSHKTYYANYNPGLATTASSEPKVKAKAPKPEAPKVEAPKPEAPKVEAPKPVVEEQPVQTPRAAESKPEPTALPWVEREVAVIRHLTDIYKALNQLTEQQDVLIAVLKDTLADLSETKGELDRERQRRNWWDKLKGLFS